MAIVCISQMTDAKLCPIGQFEMWRHKKNNNNNKMG